MKHVLLKDVNGNLVAIPESELKKANDVMCVFGMDIETIAELRKSFLKVFGSYPQSAEHVFNTFGNML